MKHKASEAVVAALLAAWPDAVRGETGDGHIPLYIAVKHKASTAVVVALIAAWPDAVKGKTGDGQIALHIAMQCCASDAVARALIASFPAAVQEVTYRRRKSFNRSSEAVGHDTPLHLLAAGKCNTVAACRSTNTLCFTLVEKGGSLAATNAHGNTPPEVATQQNKLNYHLVASFREIALFKQHRHRHLSVEHFRDWTTVSHAWCTPSAKMVALTVLLIGETYKRGLLPRLMMDCWYWILNCIPRHALRQRGCKPVEEQVELVKYLAILREAKGAAAAALVPGLD